MAAGSALSCSSQSGARRDDAVSGISRQGRPRALPYSAQAIARPSGSRNAPCGDRSASGSRMSSSSKRSGWIAILVQRRHRIFLACPVVARRADAR